MGERCDTTIPMETFYLMWQLAIHVNANPDSIINALCLQIREGSWKVAPLPADLMDRRVEITGPTDRKMVR